MKTGSARASASNGTSRNDRRPRTASTRRGTGSAPDTTSATSRDLPTPQVPGDELQLPLFIDGLADGTPFTLESLIQDYAGPGTYDLDQLSGLGSTFTLVLGEDRFQARPDGPATATITVEADGSATVAITGFQEDDGSGGYGEQVDAAIDWTCQDA